MKHVFFFLSIVLVVFGRAQNQALPKKATSSPVTKNAIVPLKQEGLSKPKEQLVEITTPYGIMVAKLYNETPLHRDNFIKLVKEGFYDSLLFHRVIKDFMIQGGDPTSKHATDTAVLGDGEAPGQMIPAEFRNNFFHKKGALAAARDGNPAKSSSNCQFYIVEGKKYDSLQLNQVFESRIKANAGKDFSYSKQQKEIYSRIGGTPFLDQNYTVFGEVISGLDIIDKIATTTTKKGDRPVTDIRFKIRLLN